MATSHNILFYVLYKLVFKKTLVRDGYFGPLQNNSRLQFFAEIFCLANEMAQIQKLSRTRGIICPFDHGAEKLV